MEIKDALRNKLEVFIRKYYQNRLIKGLIYGIGLGLAYFFALTIAEYFGRFNSQTRFVLLILMLGGLLTILGYYVLYPLAKLMKLGGRISYSKAAKIIGTHFPDVDDKILNTLQLQSISDSDSNLLQASIEQRIAGLSPIPFTKAIDFQENRKYWPILVIPVLVFVGIFISGKWHVVKESGQRIAAYNQEFLPEAPFSFVLGNELDGLEQGDDLKLELSFDGSTIPAEADLILPSGVSRMTRLKDGNFQFTLNNLQKSFDIKFSAAGFFSETFRINVLPVPQVSAFTMMVVPPAYTGIKAFETETKLVQDVPEGSEVSWLLNLRQAKQAFLLVDSNSIAFEKGSEESYSLTQKVKRSFDYAVKTSNEVLSKTSIKGNRLSVIRDEYPEIKVRFIADSSGSNVVYYSGSISDDYGFSGLRLVIKNGEEIIRRSLVLNNGVFQPIGGVLTLDSLAKDDKSDIRIYLEVSDNDGVNGAKTMRSEDYNYKLMGQRAKKEEIAKEYKKIFKGSQKNQERLEDIRKALDKMRKELMDKKSLSFSEKTKLKDLLEKQKELLQKQKEVEERIDEVQKKENKLKKKDEDVKKKEEEIDKIDTEKEKELEELLEEIERLMEKLDVKKLAEKLEQLEQANEQNQKATERKQDLLKDLKFQKDILDQAEKLEEMAEKMKELSEETPEGKEEKAEEKKEQEELGEQMEEVKEKIEEMKEENKAFEKAAEKEEAEEKAEEASEEMKKAEEEMQKGKSQKANDSQQKAGEKMSETSESLLNSMMQMQAKANELNMATLRQILENLEILSFDVESLSDESKTIGQEDPGFKRLLTEQRKLKDGAKVIEDSLTALAKKVPEIGQRVFEELDLIEDHLDRSIDDLEELRSAQAAGHQQYVMTSANNLALMLDQTLRQMQAMAAQSKPGSQQCEKPGNKPGSKPGKAQIRKMQQGLGEKMDRMKDGKKDGKGKKGEGGERGMSGKDIVQMISQQEQLRKALEELSEEEGQSGSKGNLQKAIDEMKELERELLKGELSPEYRERLREVESRLLESEKAEREQEKDEKRESDSGDDLQQLYQRELEKYLQKKEEENESIDRLPLDFRRYYKTETTKYFRE